MEEKMNI